MGEWPVSSGGIYEAVGPDTTDSGGASITTSTSNVKSAYQQIIAATSVEATGVWISFSVASDSDHFLLDISIGAVGSERVLIPDLLAASGTQRQPQLIYVPVMIPKGSRVAARVSPRIDSSAPTIACWIGGGGFQLTQPFQTVTAYGVVTADSGGTPVDAGASINTKGSWVEITAATTRRHGGLFVCRTSADNTVMQSANYSNLADLAIGGVGSEQIIIPNLRFVTCSSGSGQGHVPGCYSWFPFDIPEGSRIAIRQQCSTADAEDRVADFCVYGLS